jgi:hypothetical protein
VESNDLTGYLTLWNESFLGWPYSSPTPAHKDHITDWITANTSKGLTFKLIEFKPAAIQSNGANIVIACYWETDKWSDKTGAGDVSTRRITHTWTKTGANWQIVAGMSAPEKR